MVEITWDYIIIGGGSSGCVMANRLTADPQCRVLLLEAGGRDSGLRYRIPLLGPLLAINNPKSDWSFLTEPDPTRNGQVNIWPRGKVLGGSGSLNGTIYVRGNRGDYDGWSKNGLSGWDYDSLLKIFRKLEDDCDSNGVYGRGGPLPISRTRGAPSLAFRFLEAMSEIGVPENARYNGEIQTGAALADTTQRNGLRFSAARAYLDPVRRRANLTIVTGALARRILFDGTAAHAVEYERNGKLVTATASTEIIVSAGAINSPKILMLSGIGDASQLAKHGIDLLHHAPQVGRNLQEHPNVHVEADVNVPTITSNVGLRFGASLLAQFIIRRGGPLSHILPAIAFAKSSASLVDPDLQFHFMPLVTEMRGGVPRLTKQPAITIQANVNRTRSRGYLELRSADPTAPPRIFPNLLGDPHDLETLIAGGRMCRAALESKAMAPYVKCERAPGPAVQTDDQWREHIRAHSGIEYHPCGTCRMGSDSASVVDAQLKVRGVSRLRVVDASVIPQIPSGNINAICIGIGEKAAEFVIASRSSHEITPSAPSVTTVAA